MVMRYQINEGKKCKEKEKGWKREKWVITRQMATKAIGTTTRESTSMYDT